MRRVVMDWRILTEASRCELHVRTFAAIFLHHRCMILSEINVAAIGIPGPSGCLVAYPC